MITTFDYEALQPENLSELRSALEKDGMPSTDLTSTQAEFFRFHAHAVTLGFAGLEGKGTDLLLRSLWICPDQRDKGLGQRVLEWIENCARNRGGDTLHLLTTTAERFFLRQGYVIRVRAQAPTCISSSQEFQMLCPASASYLSKSLRSTS